ncbi:DUF6262 family protein [Heyndrickxia camelliae]|uniref:Transposase n=1 Tax=Heyndrickxia camelliae TaxID=1707093 RepID=A0A2N3LLR9_9BACI|nr:DUF6262 family protein [Heyndrickxia camelliae]PKR85568.1 transposase [Heyndrickxia camelliae]
MSTKNINEHLKQVHELKRKRTIQKVKKAIDLLMDRNEKVNFNSISKTSGVSKATLYKNTEIRELIEKMRLQNTSLPSLLQIKREKEERYKGVMISSLKKRIKLLEEENSELKEELHQVSKRLEKYQNSMS